MGVFKGKNRSDEVYTMRLGQDIRLVQLVYVDQKSWIYEDRGVVYDTPLYRF